MKAVRGWERAARVMGMERAECRAGGGRVGTTAGARVVLVPGYSMGKEAQVGKIARGLLFN